jgi:hypothetical protein
MTKQEYLDLHKEAIENLNELLIKLKDVKKEYEDHESLVDGKWVFGANPDYCEEAFQLLVIKNFCIDVLKHDGQSYANEYYGSSEW